MRRLVLGITREDFCERMAYRSAGLREREDRGSRISANRLCRFAIELGVLVAWLFEELKHPRATLRTNAQVGRRHCQDDVTTSTRVAQG